jgi:hypothetical protein
MADQHDDQALEAAQLKARRTEARADFLEARADIFEGVGGQHDQGNLAIWEQMTPTKRSTP